VERQKIILKVLLTIVMKFALAANRKLIFYVVQISIIDMGMLLG